MPRGIPGSGAKAAGSSKSPAKKLPRKKSKTPARKPSKSPARSRATTPKKTPKRQRSASTSSTRTPRRKTGAGSPKRVPTPQERERSQSKSPPKTTPRKPSSRSRSSSRSSVVTKRTSPLHVIQTKIQKATTDLKKHAPSLFASSGPRSRRAIHDAHYGNDGGTTTSHYLRHRVVPSAWQRGRATVQRYTRRFAFNVKRHLKRNWRKYVVIGGLTAAAYYSYHNQRAVQRAIQEQYNKLAALLEQQKESTFSKYFNG